MDEPKTLHPEPTEFEYQRPLAGPSPTAHRGLFLLFGVMLGAAVVLLTLHFAESPNQKVATRLGSPATQGSTSAPIVPANPTPTTGAPGGTPQSPAGQSPVLPGKPSDAHPNPTSGVATPPVSPANTQPFNPFDGSVSKSMPPREIAGHITPGTAVTLPSDAGSTTLQPTPPDQPVPKGLLITMRLSVADPAKAIKDLESIAAKESGSAIQFDESALKPDPEGAIVFVPVAKESDAEKLLGGVGSVVVSDKWSGPVTERMDRLESDATSRISELHVRRQELLVKYFDDAPEIKHVDEDSDRITKCLASLRSQKAGATIAVIKIKFLD